MNLDRISFQPLDSNGVTTLVDWAREEGWNPGRHDAAVFFQTDPEGFFGAFLDEEMIAGGSIVSYGGEFGFMGLFIVKPGYRGDGLGRDLWFRRRDLLIGRLQEGASIGMDGVVDMQPFYNKGGFEVAFRDERYEKIGTPFPVSEQITPIDGDDFPDVEALDRKCFGFGRSRFLKAWLEMPEVKTFQYRKGGQFQGFAVARRAWNGYKIGPLFADDHAVADELYQACLNACQGEAVYLDIPMVNEAAVALVKKYEAEYVFECARMYYGAPPQVDIDKIFGITTFELG